MIDKQRIGFCAFIIIGVIIIFISRFTYFDTKEFMKTAISTTAEIEDIQRSFKGRSRTGSRNFEYDYTVYVSHVVDGEKYTAELNEYDSSMRVGQRITVYYQKSDPYHVRKKGYIATIVTGIMGVMFLGAGIITNIKLSMSRKYNL